MYRLMKITLSLSILVAIAILLTPSVKACDNPVYKYALERWNTSVYELLVLSEGPLTEEQQKLVDGLIGQSVIENNDLNVYVRSVDLVEVRKEAAEEVEETLEGDEAPEQSPFLQLWERVGSPKEPTLVLLHPKYPLEHALFWSAELSEENIAKLTGSPLRQKIVEGVFGGNACVWILIKSGNEELDDLAEKSLNEGIADFMEAYEEMARAEMAAYAKMESEMNGDSPADETEDETEGEEPATDEPEADEDEDAAEDEEPELPNYALLILENDNEEEDVLREMLLRTEPDLVNYREEPIAVPVFGRGRALYGLVNKGIDGENIMDACGFMVGPCTCTVKDANPGIDLLIACRWEDRLMEIEMAKQAAEEAVEDGTETEEPIAQPTYELPSISGALEAAYGTDGTTKDDEE